MKTVPRFASGLTALALAAPATFTTEDQTDPEPAPAAVGVAADWRDLAEESFEASPEAVAADAPKRAPVRVITVVEEAGRPEIAVTEFPGRRRRAGHRESAGRP